MPRIAVGLEYLGGAYCGWQSQSGLPSVQAACETALARIADHPVELVCAGRTDSGVHALAQVAHFDATATRSRRAWVLGANSHLPSDIAVSWARETPSHFHARYSALSRTYEYVIWNRSERSALAHGRAAWIHRPLDVDRMNAAAAHLVGDHDFSAFRAAECQSHSPVRTLRRLEVDRSGPRVRVTVTANAFLHHMVRNLAGLLIAIGQGDAEPAFALEVLKSRDRTKSAATAPPEGLYFAAAGYPDAFGVPSGVSAMIHPFRASHSG